MEAYCTEQGVTPVVPGKVQTDLELLLYALIFL